MTNRLDEFHTYRSKMNARIQELDHLGIKRFFNLDTAAYRSAILNEKTKNYWDCSPQPSCAATTASIITWTNDTRQDGPPLSYMTPSMSPWSLEVAS